MIRLHLRNILHIKMFLKWKLFHKFFSKDLKHQCGADGQRMNIVPTIFTSCEWVFARTKEDGIHSPTTITGGRWSVAKQIIANYGIAKGALMKCVAFLTYNTVGQGLSNGWHEGPDGRRAFVLQNTRGLTWFATRISESSRVRDEIADLWTKVLENLSDLDQIVVYVGDSGSERAIELAATLPASKVTFVLCDCNWSSKTGRIKSAGLADATQVDCECGGHRTMRKLLNNFMQSGELQPQPAMTY